MKTCARERCPPTAVLKAMLAKGSVKFGLGMQLGRMEGAKEARAWPRTAHRTAPLSSATPLAQPHTHPSCSARRQGGSLPSPRARLTQPGQHTQPPPACAAVPGIARDVESRRELSRERGVDSGTSRERAHFAALLNARYFPPFPLAVNCKRVCALFPKWGSSRYFICTTHVKNPYVVSSATVRCAAVKVG